MVEALFNQINYVAAKQLLEVSTLRHDAISSNLANIETPGYRRVDIAPSFQAEFQRAMAAQDPRPELTSLKPRLEVDATAVSPNRDGNNVELESELLRLQQNSLEHSVAVQLLTANLVKLRTAITGRTG